MRRWIVGEAAEAVRPARCGLEGQRCLRGPHIVAEQDVDAGDVDEGQVALEADQRHRPRTVVNSDVEDDGVDGEGAGDEVEGVVARRQRADGDGDGVVAGRGVRADPGGQDGRAADGRGRVAVDEAREAPGQGRDRSAVGHVLVVGGDSQRRLGDRDVPSGEAGLEVIVAAVDDGQRMGAGRQDACRQVDAGSTL